jgi:NADPH:quinone reductase-like Zn-dependent oxidoreductase
MGWSNIYGGEILTTAIKSTAYGGVVTCCGNVASPDLPLSVYPFILRGISLLGINSSICPIQSDKVSGINLRVNGKSKISILLQQNAKCLNFPLLLKRFAGPANRPCDLNLL